MSKEYIVIANLSLTNFITACNSLVKDGAIPLGGLSSNHLGLYTQAFLKEQAPPKKKRGRPPKKPTNK